MALNINGTTGISGVDGSVSAPAVTGTDSNTGITFPSADTIKFSTGGVERMSITNSGVSGITAGITQSSTFRLTSNTSIDSSQIVLTSNLEECDNASYTRVGSAFTQSSGLFTFPATGIYLIEATGMFYVGSGTGPYNGLGIQITTDNGSNYDRVAISYGSSFSNQSYSSSYCAYQFDVTDVSTHKVRFITDAANTSAIISGTTNDNHTFFQFTRLGDT